MVHVVGVGVVDVDWWCGVTDVDVLTLMLLVKLAAGAEPKVLLPFPGEVPSRRSFAPHC